MSEQLINTTIRDAFDSLFKDGGDKAREWVWEQVADNIACLQEPTEDEDQDIRDAFRDSTLKHKVQDYYDGPEREDFLLSGNFDLASCLAYYSYGDDASSRGYLQMISEYRQKNKVGKRRLFKVRVRQIVDIDEVYEYYGDNYTPTLIIDNGNSLECTTLREREDIIISCKEGKKFNVGQKTIK